MTDLIATGKGPLQVLHLEDNPADTELVRALLERGGIACQVTHVATRAEFLAALERGGQEIIVADYTLPGFDGLSALTLASEKAPGCPLVFVSGTIGEDLAVEALRRGATDYVLKDRLGRLPAAVRRAVKEAAERRERESLERQLRQAQKMEAIGQLAGGIAHDFNNLLTVMRNNAELLLLESEQLSPEAQEYVKEITAATDRAAKLTRQLLAFGRKQTMQSQPLALNQVIANVMQMLERIIGEHIRLVFSPGAGVPLVQGDVGMIEQVLVNLVVNARDAMPQGGELSIATAAVELDAAQVQTHPEARAGRFATLTVSDTGNGIAPEHLPRIFEPFFTTKAPGVGTGLGLATVYGIVKQHQGWVEVSSRVGAGTSFRALFPALPPAAPPAG